MDRVLQSLKANQDPVVGNARRNLEAKYFANLLPKDVSLMSESQQEGEVRNLLSVLEYSENL